MQVDFLGEFLLFVKGIITTQINWDFYVRHDKINEDSYTEISIWKYYPPFGPQTTHGKMKVLGAENMGVMGCGFSWQLYRKTRPDSGSPNSHLQIQGVWIILED